MVTSLSIRLFMDQKGPIEFQIRTKEMHEVAEYGVAAHWAYKKGMKGQVNSKESAIGMNWIKEMMELQDQADDAKEFVDTVKEKLSGRRDLCLYSRRSGSFSSKGFWTD